MFAYTLVAMLSKETGLMVLPLVVIYQVICKQGNITNVYTEKNKAWTVFKYILMVTTNQRTSLQSFISLLQTTTMLFLRTSLHGTPPIFTEQDNPASFAKTCTTR